MEIKTIRDNSEELRSKMMKVLSEKEFLKSQIITMPEKLTTAEMSIRKTNFSENFSLKK